MAAGAIAIVVSLAIERFGGVVGGLLGTLPTTIVPAALGIYAVSADVASFRASMAVVPVGMAVDGLFLVCWRVFPGWIGGSPKRQLAGTLAGALGVWAVLAAGAVGLIVLLREAGVAPLWVGGTAFVLLELGGIWACRDHIAAPSGTKRVSVVVLGVRGLLAGSAIAVAGGLAAWGGPMLAGMASVFPAIFLTTMVSVWWSQGRAVSLGAVGPMILGSGAVSAFALTSAWWIPTYGPTVGGVLAWFVASCGVTVPAWLWLRR